MDKGFPGLVRCKKNDSLQKQILLSLFKNEGLIKTKTSLVNTKITADYTIDVPCP